MPYTPTTWVDYDAPYITAAELNRMEAGILAAARTDEAQAFQGLQTFAGGIADSSLTAGRVLFAGAAGRHSGSTHLSWDDTNRVLQIGGPSLDGRAVLDLWHYDGLTESAVRSYNPTAALGTTLGYDIDFRDAANTRQTYGRLLATVRDSTTGAHQGRVALQAARSGALTSILRAGNLADLVGVGGEGVQVVAGSLFMGNSVLADSARNVTAGTVKTSGLLGVSVSDEVLLGAAAGVLVFGASNGTSGARFRVNTAQTGSVLYRWQDSAGVAQMSLSPSGDLSILGGLKTGSGTERISSTGAFSGTTGSFTGALTALISGASRTIAFGSMAGTFAEGNHGHASLPSLTVSTGLTVTNDTAWMMMHPNGFGIAIYHSNDYGVTTKSANLTFPTGASRSYSFPDASGTVQLIEDAIPLSRVSGSPGSVPATASSAGVYGQVRFDSSYVYVCTAANTWKRASLATW